jgi:hypothetical protein
MKLKITILTAVLYLSFSSFAQVKFGPVVDLGYAAYSVEGKNVSLKGGLCPAFGISADKYIKYWFSLRGTALYAFKTLDTESETPPQTDQMNGQFLDFCIAGRFSDFDDDTRTLPYGLAGLGTSFTIVSKGQENHMKGTEYNSPLPYFIVGVGVGLKMGFFSEVDFSVNYQRFLVPMFTIPLDNVHARLNQFGLRVTGLF